MAQRTIVVHTDAVVRADLADALQGVRPGYCTLSFADVESLSAHMQGAEPAELLLFDGQFRLPEPLLSMFRWAIPMVFNVSPAEAINGTTGTLKPLPIPFRDETLVALLDGLLGR